MTDEEIDAVLLAAQALAITLRDEDLPARREAARLVLAAARGDAIAALSITAALIRVDEPMDLWWDMEPVTVDGRRRRMQPCGTPAAYQRHLNHGESPCSACKAAHRQVRADRRSRLQEAS